ncbi:MAG TPA: M56 family metallopeptidase, partial [Planctomycetaceae bacterium]|nr:M56 family metallopeptidase [Planctomycetaceae bacterium]
MNHSLPLTHFTDSGLRLLVDAAVQATLLLLVALAAARLLQRRAAAVRHALWVSTLASLVVLPVLISTLPRWSIVAVWPAAAGAVRWENAGASIDPSQDNLRGPVSRQDHAARLARNAPAGSGLPIAGAAGSSAPPEALAGDGGAAVEQGRQIPSATVLSHVASAIVLVWFMGCALFALRLAASSVSLALIGRPADPTADRPLWQQLAALKQELGWLRPVRLVIGRAGSMPMAWGALRPCLMLPEESRNWSERKLRAVLLHELAHLVRRDVVWQYVVEAARALYWFHPLVWWAAWRTHVEREQACDDRVLNRGVTACEYARQLLDVVSGGRLNRLGLAAGIAMASNSKLERRVRSIMDHTTDRRPLNRSALFSIVVTSLMVAVPLAMIPIAAAGDGKQPADAKGDGVTAGSRASTSDAATRNKTDAALQQRVRELIYVLRYHRVSARVAEWTGAIRELAQIGKPAVPELVAELDRTERNESLRGIPYTLRAIGDRRAIPALIRALRKPHIEDRSDYGLSVLDPGLLAFMQAHQDFPETNKNGFSYGRPINEISTALTKLTGRSEPGGDGTDARAINWIQWWNAHLGEFAAEEALPSAPAAAGNRDLVEVAGIARFGPLFPTGKEVILGPVHEVELQFDGYLNAPAYIDFDSGRRYQMLEGIGAAARSTDAARVYPVWFRDKGIDARCNSRVMGIDLQLWLVENSRWDSLESEIHAGHPLNLGREASSFMVAVDADRIDFQNEEPRTLLFITREGGRGMLQVFPHENQGSYACKIRYRLWHEQGRPAPAAPLKRTPRHESDWGPERLVMLKAPGRDRAFLLNLETGQKVTPPDSLVPAQI